MNNKYDKTFLEHLCDYESAWRMLFTFSVGLLGLMIIWIVAAEPGSETFVITLMNIVGLSGMALLSGGILWRCLW
ncbi:hypothetical protein CV102_14550 [Natronococcus pandeyae]|uniref:Uncharacterized protein n=1 Tax=Natronococcus pandeyae TaxID=2055836 RepID=A0A8J8Q3S0_9EURY|nr:hypothetical protein [Natronococcus pandeyae]TYL37938.1 hypothetical protein CV102_14550 [Natronococcus pandeyae]